MNMRQRMRALARVRTRACLHLGGRALDRLIFLSVIFLPVVSLQSITSKEGAFS